MAMATEVTILALEIEELHALRRLSFGTQKLKGIDITSYTLRFQGLALMCGRMFPEESDEVEKYVGGLLDMIRGNVMSYRPQTMEEVIEFANDQMNQKLITLTERQVEQKRKLEYNTGTMGLQQQTQRCRTLEVLTLLGLVKRGSTWDHFPCVQNATITIRGHVLPDVTIARRLAIWLVTAGVLTPTIITTFVGNPEQSKCCHLL
ncbi:hypothetical protein Tco_0991952 [Tanacetum coccineum]|uniref:Reverse transcriptase domain-containing protein n=1 Tax=Tanacetum coccineum TaxID=301880 RepID=A0ABQ5F1G7_9ASTR